MAVGMESNSLKTVAFIGSAGIPNCYGGFESFLESIAPVIVRKGFRVVVSCDGSRYSDQSTRFLGVERVFLHVRANGALSTIHDILAFFRILSVANVIVVLGVSAGPFFLLMRLFASITRKKLLVNVDGIEWRRKKFSKPVRFVLRVFDVLAQISANKIIYDNPALKPYIFSVFHHKSVFIPYSGDHVLRLSTPKVHARPTALTICRIEPENNIELMIQGALCSSIENYTIIGNWGNSDYGAKLQQHFSHEDRLSLLDPIYDPIVIAKYRESCAIYLHGHSVGGTNPSLVEMLFYDCYILCFDCIFNRNTAGQLASYFNDSKSLAYEIDEFLKSPKKHPRTPPKKYTSDFIANQYIEASFNFES